MLNKEIDELKKLKITRTMVLDDGYDGPYTDVLRVYDGVLYRTVSQDKKSVHTVFVPFEEMKMEEKNGLD